MTPARVTVVALGGNAISPPRRDLALGAERAAIDDAARELAVLARAGARLLIVHGNGPQVGRLLAAPGLGDAAALDIHVAQTQGELGYLLAEALDGRLGTNACAALVTRVLVDDSDSAFAHPTKPVGPVLTDRPAGVPSASIPGGGWRRVVASPRPVAVVEQAAIATLLASHHVIAGGGGGVALAGAPRRARPAVVDKDWVASMLAIALGADRLIYVTDVAHAFDRFGHAGQTAIRTMSPAEARTRLSRGVFAPGSMAPKIESAAEFVERVGRPAVIAALGSVEGALMGAEGTAITP